MKKNTLHLVLFILLFTSVLPVTLRADTLRCDSINGNYRTCGSNILSARLVRQLSDYPCINGQTYGVQGGQIWVNNRCSALFSIETETGYRLYVNHSGQGSGFIESSPGGIRYPEYPQTVFPSGTAVSLHATPAFNSVFVGWSGDCAGKGDCTVIMSQERSATAYFNTIAYLPWLSLILKNDRASPSVMITLPTSSPTYTTGSNPLRIGGTASDTVTQLTWANDRGGSGTCIGTKFWSASGIVLTDSSPNRLTVTARDAEGNTSTDTVTVSYDPAGPDCDYPNLPDPVLEVTGRQTVNFGSGFYVIYSLTVSNRAEYPNDLFVQDAIYPSCGNTTGSRTNVEIYDNDNNLITEHCNFTSPDELESFSFIIYNDSSYPSSVYIRMVDQACNNAYLSNSVTTNDLAPILFNPNSSLAGLNDTPDPQGGLPYSTFNLSFDFNDSNGNANSAAGATLTGQFQFTNGGNYFEEDHTEALDGVNGYGDTVQFEQQIRFDDREGVVVTFILTDGAGNSSNPLQITIDRPTDAN